MSGHARRIPLGLILVVLSVGLRSPLAKAGGTDCVLAPFADKVPQVGAAFDAAPFGMPLDTKGGKAYGLKWGEPRKIQQVVVEFKAAAPAADVRLQYWHRHWDGKADPILAERDTGGQGWTAMDDWTNGEWKDADVQVRKDGPHWIYTFNPTQAKEFPKVAPPGVTYRKTLQFRIVCEQPLPDIAAFHAYTQAQYQRLSVRIVWGKPAEPQFQNDLGESGRLEVFNGAVTREKIIDGSGAVLRDKQFQIPKEGGGLQAEILMAVDPLDARYDRTIVTVRGERRSLSFAADEVARGERVLVDDLGVLVTRGDDAIALEGARKWRTELPGKTVYARVAEHSEQTLSRAWNDMPLRRPMFFPHGLPGNRNVVRQEPNGRICLRGVAGWINIPPSDKDTRRKKWPGEWLNLDFGLPADHLRGGRALEEGYLPLLRAWWQDGPLYYEQLTSLDALSGKLEDIAGIQGDDPTVLLMKVRVVNTSAETPATAALRMENADKPAKLTLDGDRVMGEFEGQSRVRYLLKAGEGGTLQQDGEAIRWSRELKAGDAHELVFCIPSITPNDEEVAALRQRDFEADVARILAFWRKQYEGSARITTSERWLNDFYRAHLRHQLINCYREVGADRLLAHVGTFHYGVFSNESVMMLNDLECRGRHDLVERCLETWLNYQGTVGLPGNFKSKEGVFYGAAGHEHGGYNKHHGYVMWGMAEHWWMTRDRKWMERAAPKLLKACEWVISERQATMTTGPDGKRPIEYGFMPAGGLEDVQDYWYWMATNAATVWGFDALAAALADFGHPDGQRLVKEARAYHDDVVAGIREAAIRTPVVRLRDGRYIPKIPSEPYTRGRAYGWIRETLEGSIFLPVLGLLDPNSPQCRWILQDYEDNLYISDRYGYAIPNFESFWFSRGGFSMQSQLLDGPIPYLQRDEIKHFLRAYFNGFAAAFEPDITMCNEHALPELGYPAGDMFKSSDEAQSTYWLRLMFVHEQGEDLYLGQAIPRYWLAGGKTVGIEGAASHFGPLSLRISANEDASEIQAVLTPPVRNPPRNIFLRLRHPGAKPIQSVTLNGQAHAFDAKKEWAVLPGRLNGEQKVVARY